MANKLLITGLVLLYIGLQLILIPVILQSILAAFGIQVSFWIAFAIWNLLGVILAAIKN